MSRLPRNRRKITVLSTIKSWPNYFIFFFCVLSVRISTHTGWIRGRWYLRIGKWRGDERFVSGGRVCEFTEIVTNKTHSQIRPFDPWRFVYYEELKRDSRFVYYEELKRELKRIHIYGCRCNEGRKSNSEGPAMGLSSCCLLWIEKVRDKDKTYIWVSVWWKTKN